MILAIDEANKTISEPCQTISQRNNVQGPNQAVTFYPYCTYRFQFLNWSKNGFLGNMFLPPVSAVEVIELEPCFCLSVCVHSHGRTV